MKNIFFNLIILFSFCLSSLFSQKITQVEKEQLKSPNPKVTILNDNLDIKEIKDYDDLEYELSNLNKPVIVDFYSTRCGPCKKLSEILKNKNLIFKDKIKILKVNTDMNVLLAIKYNIKSTPTILVFDNKSKVLFKKIGIADITNLLNQIENLKDKNSTEILEYLKKIK